MGNMLKMKKKGFTMVELLVVLVIVAILAAVAAPIYMGNVKRSIASEAVAAMSVIRQAERENNLKAGVFVEVDATNYLSTTTLGSVIDPMTQYFSEKSYLVSTTGTPAFADTSINPSAEKFVITANGSATVSCANDPGAASASATTNCAVKGSQATGMKLQMDNSGRVFVNYSCPAGVCDSTKWEKY